VNAFFLGGGGGEGSRSRCYGRTAALRLIVQPCDQDDSFFSYFRVMEHRWNETDRGKPKYSRKNLSQCHFVRHKSHMDLPGIETVPPRWEAGDWAMARSKCTLGMILRGVSLTHDNDTVFRKLDNALDCAGLTVIAVVHLSYIRALGYVLFFIIFSRRDSPQWARGSSLS
jgi:hypothetical protein